MPPHSHPPSEATDTVVRFSPRRVLRYWVLLIIVLSTFPWYIGPPDWETVAWVPFQDLRFSLRRMLDAFLNFCLYVPLGMSVVCSGIVPRRFAIVQAGLLALMLATACEFYQIFSPVRYPTMTDVATNVLGGVIGAAIGSRLRGGRVILVCEE
jgi:VanZ family protein